MATTLFIPPDDSFSNTYTTNLPYICVSRILHFDTIPPSAYKQSFFISIHQQPMLRYYSIHHPHMATISYDHRIFCSPFPFVDEIGSGDRGHDGPENMSGQHVTDIKSYVMTHHRSGDRAPID